MEEEAKCACWGMGGGRGGEPRVGGGAPIASFRKFVRYGVPLPHMEGKKW